MTDAQKLIVEVLRWHDWKGRSLAPTRCLCGEFVRDMAEHRADEIDKAFGRFRKVRGHGQLMRGGYLTGAYSGVKGRDFVQWISGWREAPPC